MIKFSSLLKIILPTVVIGSGYFMLKQDPPIYNSRIVITGSVKPVQDSMVVLRQICEQFKPEGFMNCIVQPWDSLLYFNSETLGKVNTISVDNWPYKRMPKADVVHVLSLMKFLN